jgi:hypothetical protein
MGSILAIHAKENFVGNMKSGLGFKAAHRGPECTTT